jgi:hypothetical protein
MRALLFVLAGLTSVAAPDEMRRFEYPQDKFSIAVPDSWTEAGPEALAKSQGIIQQIMPQVAGVTFGHGFTSTERKEGLAWVAITLTHVPVNEMAFEMVATREQTVDDLMRKMTSNGVLSESHVSNVTLDRSRHLAWSTYKGALAGNDIEALSGTFITKTGAIGVGCYSRAADFEKHQQTCRRIIESVVIDPKIAKPAKRPELEDLTEADYEPLARQLEGGDLSVDFRTLRLACMKSPKCEPRSTPDELAAFSRASAANKYAEAVEIAERLLRQGFVNVEMHANLVKLYELLHEPEKSKFHENVLTGLAYSVLLSGDGKTTETAFEVICDREEYTTLSVKQLPYMGAGVATSRFASGGHYYERWDVDNPKTGKSETVYFNVDAFSAKSRPRSK